MEVTSLGCNAVPNETTRQTPGPISRLLTELFAEVIRLALPEVDFTHRSLVDQARLHVRRLYGMRLIAKRWQEIIDGTPTFWTFVVRTLPPHVHEATIRRSGTSPLVIVSKYELLPNGNARPASSVDDFLERLAHTFPRWSAYCGPMVPEYFNKPAPRLQTIILTGCLRPATTWELLGGKTENLRHVDLSFMPIQWRTGLFTQLNVLKLDRLISPGFTTTRLLDILRASPYLKRLHLTGMNPTIENLPPLQVIRLPNLRFINIDTCEVNFTADILRQIRAPYAIQFHLGVVLASFQRGLQAFLYEELQPFQKLFRTAHIHKGLSILSFDYNRIRWATIGGEGSQDHFSFSVVIVCNDWTPCIRWVESIILDNPGLRISFTGLGNVGQPVFETLASMRCITRVHASCTEKADPFIPFLELIGKPLSSDPSLPSMPHLQELVLSDIEGAAQNLLDMVHSRFNSVPWKGVQRSPLTINFGRSPVPWIDYPRPILDLTTLMNIRETEGVERVRFVGSEQLDGTLAPIFDEEVVLG